jgi:hypothetical protein
MCDDLYLNLELKLTNTELIVLLLNDTNQGTVQLSSASIDLEDLRKALDKLDQNQVKV